MPQAQVGYATIQAGQIPDGLITSPMIALDTIAAVDVAANAIGDSEIAAHTTTKITVPATLFTVASQAQGDIIYHNGTNWVRLAAGTSGQFLKTLGAGANPVYATASQITKNGVTSRAMDAASGDQTIAHGLSSTPVFVRITATHSKVPTNGLIAQSIGTYNGTTTASVRIYMNEGTPDVASGNSSTNIIEIFEIAAGSNKQVATIAVDATNITLSWTKSGITSAENIYIMWEAY